MIFETGEYTIVYYGVSKNPWPLCNRSIKKIYEKKVPVYFKHKSTIFGRKLEEVTRLGKIAIRVTRKKRIERKKKKPHTLRAYERKA